MELKVSAPIKIFAVVAVLAAVVLGGGMMLLGRPPAEADADPIVLPRKQGTGPLAAIGKAEQVAAKANAAVAAPGKVAEATPEPVGKAKPVAAPEPEAKAKATPKPAPKPVAKAKAKAKPKPQLIAANGLPTRIVHALGSRPIVVVALWSKGAKIDELARDEAAKGAASAGAGYVPLDLVGNSREAEALTLKLGVVLRSPAVLIFTRPDVLTFTLPGFQDHETVAQAAANALR